MHSVGKIFYISAVKRFEISIHVGKGNALFYCNLAAGIGVNRYDTVRSAIGLEGFCLVSRQILLVNNGSRDIDNDLCASLFAKK